MNDFTREELETIRNQIYSCMDRTNLWRTTENNALVAKIQSMIDDYCEITIPTMADYCCSNCNEEWHNCECKK